MLFAAGTIFYTERLFHHVLACDMGGNLQRTELTVAVSHSDVSSEQGKTYRGRGKFLVGVVCISLKVECWQEGCG